MFRVDNQREPSLCRVVDKHAQSLFRKTDEPKSYRSEQKPSAVCEVVLYNIERTRSEVTVNTDTSSETQSYQSEPEFTQDKKSIATPSVAAKNAEACALADSLILKKDNVLKLPSFKMNEIAVGNILGKGGFYDVLAIKYIDISVNKTTPKTEDRADEEVRHGDIMTVQTLDTRESIASRRQGYGETENANNYVIKCIKPSITKHKTKYLTAIKDSVIETYILANLNHQHIIKVRGVVACNTNDSHTSLKQRIYSARYCQDAGYRIVMDRIYGTLDKKLKQWRNQSKSPFGIFFANKKQKMLFTQVKMASQLSETLMYLHKLNIVYRDIKPENIGFDLNGDVKVFDFGLAQELRPNKKGEDGLYLLSLAGTARYMAPEIVRGERYNQSVDVYSYGVLLWEIFTLEKAFQGFDMSDILSQAKGKRVKLRMSQSIYPSVKSLIRESCLFKWKARPTFEMLVRKLQHILRETS